MKPKLLVKYDVRNDSVTFFYKDKRIVKEYGDVEKDFIDWLYKEKLYSYKKVNYYIFKSFIKGYGGSLFGFSNKKLIELIEIIK